MIIVGFSGALNSDFYVNKFNTRFVGHDSSVAILIDGHLKYAAEEERFSGEKHTAELPFRSLLNGLKYCNLKLEDVDYFAFPWKLNSLEILKTGINHLLNIPLSKWLPIGSAGFGIIQNAMSSNSNFKALHHKLNSTITSKVIAVDHHKAHITSSFSFSGYNESAVLSIDGSGGYLSALSGVWKNDVFTPMQSIYSPHSLGILFGLVTEFLGFRSGYDEYKVMGMAAYGDANNFRKKFQKIIWNSGDRFKTKYTGLILDLPYCMKSFEKILGISKRIPATEITQEHFDIAATIQTLVEEQILRMVQQLRIKSDSDNLCLSGGVFQNSVANGKILSSGIFKNIFIPPVPGDNGTAMGAAMYAFQNINKKKYLNQNYDIAYTGPSYVEDDYLEALNYFNDNIIFKKSNHICSEAAKALSEEKVIGWFQGRMEYGARALGNRSILALPAKKAMMDKVNITIKNRESFRPFAASIPLEKVSDYFIIKQESPYMQFVVPIRKDKINRLQAINHFNTCRIQTVHKNDNPLFHALLEEVELLTGDPILLNTSFNGKDEPIVCNPFNALNTFMNLNLDVLFMGDFIITKKE